MLISFFIKDENDCYPFDYLVHSIAFEKDNLSIFDYFDSLNVNKEMKANLILLCLDRMIPIFNNLPIIEMLDIKIIIDKYKYIYDYTNTNNENIFFILSKTNEIEYEGLFNNNYDKIKC